MHRKTHDLAGAPRETQSTASSFRLSINASNIGGEPCAGGQPLTAPFTGRAAAAAAGGQETFSLMSSESPSRREVLAGSAAVGATILTGALSAAAEENRMKKTFTILHTNDMHSAFIGMGPASDYTPFTLNDDKTRGGYARLAGLIAKRKEARKDQGPVLVLDAGDYSMGTAFGAASRETGGELQLMSRMGYDATTFGNHDFDLGPEGLGKSIGVAAKAGRVPAVVASNTNFAGTDANAGRSPAPGQGWGDPPPPRDRARRHSLRHLRGARQRGQFLHHRRGCCYVLRRHRDRQGDGEDPPRDGKGGCGHRSEPRRRGEREGRPLSPTATTCAWPRRCRASTW